MSCRRFITVYGKNVRNDSVIALDRACRMQPKLLDTGHLLILDAQKCKIYHTLATTTLVGGFHEYLEESDWECKVSTPQVVTSPIAET